MSRDVFGNVNVCRVCGGTIRGSGSMYCSSHRTEKQRNRYYAEEEGMPYNPDTGRDLFKRGRRRSGVDPTASLARAIFPMIPGKAVYNSGRQPTRKQLEFDRKFTGWMIVFILVAITMFLLYELAMWLVRTWTSSLIGKVLLISPLLMIILLFIIYWTWKRDYSEKYEQNIVLFVLFLIFLAWIAVLILSPILAFLIIIGGIIITFYMIKSKNKTAESKKHNSSFFRRHFLEPSRFLPADERERQWKKINKKDY